MHTECGVSFKAEPCGCVGAVLVENRAGNTFLNEIYIPVGGTRVYQSGVLRTAHGSHAPKHFLQGFIAYRVVTPYFRYDIFHAVANIRFFAESYPIKGVIVQINGK